MKISNNVNFNGKFSIDISRINDEHVKIGLNKLINAVENKYKGTVSADFTNNKYYCCIADMYDDAIMTYLNNSGIKFSYRKQ